MDNSAFMQLFQSCQHWPYRCRHLFGVHLSVFPDVVTEGLPFDVFHHDVGRPVLLEVVQDCYNARLISESAYDFRFSEESLPFGGKTMFRVVISQKSFRSGDIAVHVVSAEEFFDCDFLTCITISPTVCDAESALAKYGPRFIAPVQYCSLL